MPNEKSNGYFRLKPADRVRGVCKKLKSSVPTGNRTGEELVFYRLRNKTINNKASKILFDTDSKVYCADIKKRRGRLSLFPITGSARAFAKE